MKWFDTPRKVALWIVGVVLILMAVTVVLNHYTPNTNDAAVQAFVVPVSSDVSGRVVAVYVQDNQLVKQGQKLLQLDPAPYEISLKASQHDYQVAPTEFNQAKTTLAQNPASQTQYLAVEKNLTDAKAALNLAQYNYKQTTVVAPGNGYITNLQIQPGKYAHAGEALTSIVDSSQCWVVVNYKENNLGRIQPGQEALVSFNSVPGKIFSAKVEGIAWGVQNENDAVYAGLPQIDKTTNWIRLAQRFPVKILLDSQQISVPLRVGTTAIVTVYTTDNPILCGVAYSVQFIRTYFQFVY